VTARARHGGTRSVTREAKNIINLFKILVQTALLPNEILYQHLYINRRRGVGRYTANLNFLIKTLNYKTEDLKSTAEFPCLLGRLFSAENSSIRHDLRGLDDLIQDEAGAGENLRNQ
jgi:hypothetical protein